MRSQFKRSTVAILCGLCVSGFASSGKADIFTSPAGLRGPDTLVTFETGSTALPGVPNVSFGGGDATFSTALFGHQVFGNLSAFTGYTTLTMQFANPVTEVGAYVGLFDFEGPSRITINVFGPHNQLIEGETISPAANYQGQTPTYVGFFEAGGISSIQWSPAGGGSDGFIAVDNVSFGGPVAVVPEPTSAAILAALLVWAGIYRSGRFRA